MTNLRIWQVAFIEHRLQTLHGPAKHTAVRDAYTYGFEVDDIVTITGLPVEEVRRIILRK
jgi:hypothetical protein